MQAVHKKFPQLVRHRSVAPIPEGTLPMRKSRPQGGRVPASKTHVYDSFGVANPAYSQNGYGPRQRSSPIRPEIGLTSTLVYWRTYALILRGERYRKGRSSITPRKRTVTSCGFVMGDARSAGPRCNITRISCLEKCYSIKVRFLRGPKPYSSDRARTGSLPSAIAPSRHDQSRCLESTAEGRDRPEITRSVVRTCSHTCKQFRSSSSVAFVRDGSFPRSSPSAPVAINCNT